jgi:hypothetical protein
MAEKRVIELEVKTTGSEKAEKSAKTLKQQYAEAKRELQDMALAYGENSEQAIKAARRAGELKDVIDDTSEAIKNLQGGGTFSAVTNSLSGVVGGFGAVQGAINLVGVESEEVEKALLKLQSVMAISEGLRSIEDLGRSFGALRQIVITGYASMSKAAVQQAVATGTATTAQKIMNTVMKANPILLVVSGVMALVGAFALLSSSTDNQIEKERALAKLRKEERERQNADIKVAQDKKRLRKGGIRDLERELELLEAQGASEKVLLDKKKQIINEEINLISLAASKRTKLNADGVLEFGKLSREEYQLKLDLLNQLKVLDAEYAKSKRENAQKEKKEIKKERDEIFYLEQEELNKLTWARQDRLNAQKQAEIDFFDESGKRNQAYWQKQIDDQKKADAEVLESQKKLNDLKFQATLQGLTLISDIAEVFGKKGEAQAKKAFQIQKAVSIASALITTYQSAVSAYQSQFLPIPDPSSPVRGGIAAGIAIAAGLGNVAKISSQRFNSGGSVSGGSGGGGSSTPNQVTTPNFNLVGQSGASSLGLETGTLKAYVVSGEVTSQQALDRNRLKNATFG